MNQSNSILAKRIAELERQLSTANSNNQALAAQVEALRDAGNEVYAEYIRQEVK